jgi:hypothetical protein
MQVAIVEDLIAREVALINQEDKKPPNPQGGNENYNLFKQYYLTGFLPPLGEDRRGIYETIFTYINFIHHWFFFCSNP